MCLTYHLSLNIILKSTTSNEITYYNKFSKLTRLTAAFGNAALRYISYRFNWSSEKFDTRTLQSLHSSLQHVNVMQLTMLTIHYFECICKQEKFINS